MFSSLTPTHASLASWDYNLISTAMTAIDLETVPVQKRPLWLENIRSLTWLPYVLALAAGIFYLAQSWGYAHSLESVLDEGAYLYKGYAFLTGQYRIYQDYGFWSNHMPLAFYIPGNVQAIFGPGLRTGRYFAVFTGILMLLGLWIVTRRLSGPWWAALVLAGTALNPAIVKMYSTAISQVLIACMLVWALALTLGEKRPLWQLLLGSILTAAIWMTRINLFPFLPLLIVYIFWQHGRKAGLAALLAAAVALFLMHIPFWPGILRIYAYWIPERLAPFLSAWRPPEATPYWDPEIDLPTRINSFFRTFRYHFLALTSLAAAWIFWPRKLEWRSTAQYRIAVFLSALFIALFALHFWATTSKNYCAFCLEGYTAFFASLGWILLALTFASWSRDIAWWRQALAAGYILIVSIGIGFSTFEDLGRTLLELDFPWLGLPSIAVLLENKYGIMPRQGQYLVAAGAGAATGVVILGIAGIIALLWRRQNGKSQFARLAIVSTLAAGVLLTPTIVLGRGFTTYDCWGDVIASYEAAGLHLAKLIPPGSRVYWKGGLSVAPLLYVPGIRIYPSQVNGDYSYRLDGDPQALEKYGYWNQNLAEGWLDETDFVLIEERYYRKWFKDWVDQDRFVELEPTTQKAACKENSAIRIFQRVR